jgi:hypothetical protein
MRKKIAIAFLFLVFFVICVYYTKHREKNEKNEKLALTRVYDPWRHELADTLKKIMNDSISIAYILDLDRPIDSLSRVTAGVVINSYIDSVIFSPKCNLDRSVLETDTCSSNSTRLFDSTSVSRTVAFWQKHEKTLNIAKSVYKIPPEIIVSILRIETDLGEYTGCYLVLSTLSSLYVFLHPDSVAKPFINSIKSLNERDSVLSNQISAYRDSIASIKNFLHHRTNQESRERGKKNLKNLETTLWAFEKERKRIPGEILSLERKFKRRQVWSAQWRSWALEQLKFFLLLAKKNEWNVFALPGSNRGAFGWAQFVPKTFFYYAHDGDGDGRIDFFAPDDAIFNIAHHLNYLAGGNWQKNKLRALRGYNRGRYPYVVLRFSEEVKRYRPMKKEKSHVF